MGVGGLTEEERLHREKLRLRAARWFEQGVAQAEVARRLEVPRQAVHKWHQAWKAGGAAALRSKGPCGGSPYVTDEAFARVAAVLEAGPQAAGFSGQAWTLARAGRVIAEVTGAVYAGPAGVWRLLKRLGWSRQVPARRAYERDEQEVATWRTEVWPRIKPPRPGPER